MLSLPGDKYTEEECIEIAKKYECPTSNICRYCGEPAVVMAFTMTGACCINHSKLRFNPNCFDEDYTSNPEQPVKSHMSGCPGNHTGNCTVSGLYSIDSTTPATEKQDDYEAGVRDRDVS